MKLYRPDHRLTLMLNLAQRSSRIFAHNASVTSQKSMIKTAEAWELNYLAEPELRGRPR